MKPSITLLIGGTALTALSVGSAAAACSGANCAMAGGGKTFSAGQIVVPNANLIGNAGGTFQKGSNSNGSSLQRGLMANPSVISRDGASFRR